MREIIKEERRRLKIDVANPAYDGRCKYGIRSVRVFRAGDLATVRTYKYTFDDHEYEEKYVSEVGAHSCEHNEDLRKFLKEFLEDEEAVLRGKEFLEKNHIYVDRKLIGELIDRGFLDREKLIEVWEEAE